MPVEMTENILYGGLLPHSKFFEYNSLGEIFLQRLNELGENELLVKYR